MWNEPTTERLSKIPRLYETENIPLQDKLIHLHFFIGGSDWFACEFDGEDIFFGFAILNNDLINAEWGYISFSELKAIKMNGWLEIDCEVEHAWKIRCAFEVDKIREASGWRNKEQSENHVLELLEQDFMDDVLELECPECGGTLTCEPDAKKSYCHECGKVVKTMNPLMEQGLI
jgi:hypothetical protein